MRRMVGLVAAVVVSAPLVWGQMSADEAMGRLRARQEGRRRQPATTRAAVAAASGPATRGVEVPALNARVLAFARERVGRQVGDGECWTLANEAFGAAGVRPPDTYVWGRPLAEGETVLPGDVVQFESVRLEKGGGLIVLGMPRHTAIVARAGRPGVITVLHQNFAGRREVTELTLDLKTKTAGTVVIYRPEGREGVRRRGQRSQ